MSMREYEFWKIAAIGSFILWIIMIFLDTITIFSAVVGGTLGCMCFYYWIRILSPGKNARLSYCVGVLVTILLNKIMGVFWLGAILISFVMMFFITYATLYVCTRKYSADEMTKRKMPSECNIWYRSNIRRLYGGYRR